MTRTVPAESLVMTSAVRMSREPARAAACGGDLFRAAMASPAKHQPAASPTGEFWEVGGVRFYRSTEANVLLFAPTRLALANGAGGRCQAALTQFRQLQAGTWRTVAGSALLVVSLAVQLPAGCVQSFADCWRAALKAQGYVGDVRPVFLPLPRRRQRIQVLLDRDAGGGRLLGGGELESEIASLVVELTGKGAEAWAGFLRERRALSGCVRLSYEYPRMLHEAEACFSFDGTKFLTPQFRGCEMSLTMTLRARSWVEESVEVDLASLLEPLDASYVSVVSVDSTAQFPVIVSGQPSRREE